MKDKDLFDGFSNEKEKEYSREARRLYDEKEVEATEKRWKAYTSQPKEAIKAEGQKVYEDLAALTAGGADPASGLGRLYTTSPDFMGTFNRVRQGLPEYFNEAIQAYLQKLAKGNIV